MRLTAIVPPRWYDGEGKAGCDDNPNICSIALRIDYCSSSALFVGDAEELEEADLSIGNQVTLLQVGHHGSHTSSTPSLLDQAQPRYAVISSAKPGEGTNLTYCHPRSETIAALTVKLGGPGTGAIHAFPSSAPCKTAPASQWVDQPASDHLWFTARDGDITLTTAGDGAFKRE